MVSLTFIPLALFRTGKLGGLGMTLSNHQVTLHILYDIVLSIILLALMTTACIDLW